MRQRQSGLAPALAFGMAAPALNVGTIVLIGVVLGWGYAVLRVLVALVGVVGVSMLTARLVPDAPTISVPLHEEPTVAAQRTGFVGWLSRWLVAAAKMTVLLIPIYVGMVLVMGLTRAWLFPVGGAAVWGNSLLVIVLIALAGTLFVIPTAGEVPIVQGLLAAGLAMGPAAALLITLPITSLPALAMIRTAVPTRALLMVAAGIWTLGIVAGIVAALVL